MIPNIPLNIQLWPRHHLSAILRKEIILLCNRAHEEEMESLFETFTNATHLLGYYDGQLVSHALWMPRYLQSGTGPQLRTAYLETVATDQSYRNRGFATAII